MIFSIMLVLMGVFAALHGAIEQNWAVTYIGFASFCIGFSILEILEHIKK